MMFSTRRAICLLVISLYLVVLKCNGEGYEPAPNCAKNECPAYTVVHSEKEFEIRSYKDARWVHAPTISSTSYKLAASKSFQILSSYFNGENRENMKIKMTSPVLVGVENSSYTLYFYLPQEYQQFAPKPVKAGEVNPTKLPEHKYAAVRRFDGLINDAVIPVEVDALKKSLQSTPYQRAAAVCQFMVAAYNSPSDLTDRVNEILLWFD